MSLARVKRRAFDPVFMIEVTRRMYGIIDDWGPGPVAEQLVDSPKCLEYRSYDSAGIATLEGDALERRRAAALTESNSWLPGSGPIELTSVIALRGCPPARDEAWHSGHPF